jgi:hypothetical protein
MAEEKQEGQKTVVSFIVGLLIGGLLVWAFSGPAEDAPKKDTVNKATEEKVESESEETMIEGTTVIEEGKAEVVVEPVKATLPVGDGKISVANQPASVSVKLDGATYPVSEGWVGVRDYQNGQLGTLLGVVRFSEEQGLVPSAIVLQRSTKAGNDYAIVVYKENGDRQFNLAEDVQVETVFSTFTAQ